MNKFSFSETKCGIILGAGHGIGQEIFEQLSRDYPHIELVGTFHNKKRNQLDVAQYLDPLNEEQVIEFAKKFQKIDFIISSIGYLGDEPEKSLRQVTLESMTKSFQVNCLHFPLVVKHLYRKLNAGSLLGVLSAMVGSSTDNRLGGWYGYRSSKAALNMVVKNMSLELRRSIVVAVHPGTTQTSLSENFLSGIKHKVYAPDQTARHLITFFENRTLEDSGCFFHWNGEEIPY